MQYSRLAVSLQRCEEAVPIVGDCKTGRMLRGTLNTWLRGRGEPSHSCPPVLLILAG